MDAGILGMEPCRLLLGAGILDLERLSVRLASWLLREPAVRGWRMASGTLGARPVRLVLEAGPLGSPVLIDK